MSRSDTPATSRPARITSTRTNRLLSHPQKNTEACDELRRRIQMQASPALIESLASTAEVSLNSVYHQIEGGQKLSGDLIVALLKHLPTHEIEDAVNAGDPSGRWCSTPRRVRQWLAWIQGRMVA